MYAKNRAKANIRSLRYHYSIYNIDTVRYIILRIREYKMNTIFARYKTF